MTEPQHPPTSDYEQTLKDYYETLWAHPERQYFRHTPWDCGWHFGYAKPGDTSPDDAVTNMNAFIGDTLGLSHKPGSIILDAGCGMGATTLFLASRYPQCCFTGLSLAPSEITLATRLQHDRQITNARFLQGSYLHTPFANASFDAVYALESASHAENKTTFVHEMHRILKPGGTLLILDLIPQRTFRYLFHGASLLQQHVVTLASLNHILQKEGFQIRSLEDLLKDRRVNLLQILNFTLWYSADAQRRDTSTTKKPRPSLLRWSMERSAILPSFFLEFLSILYARYGYYVITAEKPRESPRA